MAPIVLMVSLQNTPASTASLLLNFEGVGTTLIALLFFKEAISRRAWMAILVITLASVFLSTNFSEGIGLSLGALGIILACVLWGLDNNLTRNISGKDPLVIVAWKGVTAGTFSFLLAFLLGNAMPSFTSIISTMILGLSYGLILFILSMPAQHVQALHGTARWRGCFVHHNIYESPSFAYTADFNSRWRARSMRNMLIHKFTLPYFTSTAIDTMTPLTRMTPPLLGHIRMSMNMQRRNTSTITCQTSITGTGMKSSCLRECFASDAMRKNQSSSFLLINGPDSTYGATYPPIAVHFP
jgi:hypothetical protein